MQRLIGGSVGLCVAALLLVACGSSPAPAHRSVSEVVSCLRARGLLPDVPAGEIGTVITPGGGQIVPVVAGPGVVEGIVILPSTAAATRRLGRRVPAGSPAGSEVQAGNVVLIEEQLPTVSLAVRSAVEVCAFGAGASGAQTYAPASVALSAASGGTIPPGYSPGRQALLESGCLGCHRIGSDGNSGPGPDLSDIGRRLSRSQILTTLVDPTAPMPSFRNLPPDKLRALVVYLSGLRVTPPAEPGS